MEQYLASWAMLAAVMLAAVISPGPDFVMALRNSLQHGRRAGVFTAFGFGLGASIHASYALAGLGAVMAHAAWLFVVIKYVGAAYLVYLGFQALRSQGSSVATLDQGQVVHTPKSDGAALRDGFITNILNPKAVLFFVALFTQIVAPSTPFAVQLGYIATCMVIIVSWFSAVAFLMTLPAISRRYIAYSKHIDRTLGVFLLGFGVKLALTKA